MVFLHIENVGKTSIIRALTSDEGLINLPKVHSPVKIENECFLENCSMTIIDSWCGINSTLNIAVEEEVKKANVILLVYDITRQITIEKLSEYWLKKIPKISQSPIILIGNKLDEKYKNPQYSLENTIKCLYKHSCNFEFAIECSALTLDNLSDILLYSQHAVIYPISPLYDIKTEEITPEYKRALSLIFKRYDKDRDFLLNDNELISMDAEIFQSDMTSNDIEELKKTILEDTIEGIQNNAITFKGFCYLQVSLIQKLQNNICWTVLRYHNYDNFLNLSLKFQLNIEEFQYIELSPTVLTFLTIVFDQYAVNDLLSIDSLSQIFEAAEYVPWGSEKSQKWLDIEKFIQITNNSLPYDSWLALWHLLTWLDYANCLKYLVLIGCDLNYSDIFIIKSSNPEYKDKSRNIIVGYLIGYNQVGKSWILNGLINRNSEEKPTSSIKICCGIIKENPVPWEKKYILMIEYPVVEYENMISNINKCDCAIIITNENDISKKFIKEIEVLTNIRKMYVDNSGKLFDNTKRKQLYNDIYYNYLNDQSYEKLIESAATEKLPCKRITQIVTIFFIVAVAYIYKNFF